MNYFLYQIKVAIIMTGFYLIYVLVLKRSTLFTYRRFYLLCSMVAAFVIPFINISFESPQLYQYYQLLPEVTVGNSSQSSSYDYHGYVYTILSLVTVIFLLNLTRQIYGIYKLISASTTYRRNGYNLVETEGNIAFSFLNYIFLGKSISKDDAHIILAHEKVHTTLLHSIDILVIDIILLMQWFNPIAWLYRKEIKENHEFEADNLLLKQGISSDQYQQLLLNQMFQTMGVRFSSFNYNSFIKNRIKMMTTIPRAGKTRFLLAAIMSFLVVLMFSFKAESVNTIAVASLGGDTIKKKPVKDVPYLTPDKLATFNGSGLDAFAEYIAKNIQYPTEAVKNKIQGKVIVQFVVGKNGNVEDATVLRGVSPMLDKEAIRVVKGSPAWTPAQDKGKTVKQIFTLPVLFKLE